jgi:2-polyprenyl-6-methoxyphenol hydroxylase-like FAD-dependent oxidoreductase
MYGYEVSSSSVLEGSDVRIILDSVQGHDRVEVIPRFVVGADGTHSLVRRLAGIPFTGESDLQQMLNVHFVCKGLRARLTPRSAMLYFIFNEVRVDLSVSVMSYST